MPRGFGVTPNEKCRMWLDKHWNSACTEKGSLVPPVLENNGKLASHTTDVPPDLRDAKVGKRPDASSMPGAQGEDTFIIRIVNFSESTTEANVEALVKPFGPVHKLYLAKDKIHGTCKGFAYIHFKFRNDAAKAISTLDGHDYDNRILTANWAKPPAHSNQQ